MSRSHSLSFPGTHRQIALKLHRWYLPFVIGLGLLTALAAVCCVGLAGITPPPWNMLLCFPALFLLLTLVWSALALRVLFDRQEYRDPLEFGFEREWLAELYELVDGVARKRQTPRPDEIRLHLLDVAHVYEQRNGKRILAVGGLALASLSRRSLRGIIAHELGHFNEGDTTVLRRCRDTFLLMGELERAFQASPLNVVNPLNWLVRGYHRLFLTAWAGMQQENEFAADRYEVEHVGARQCAQTSILLHALERLPWVKLSSVAEFCVTSRMPVEQLFSVQARRLRQTSSGEWREACGKALQEKTRPLDSHPCLRDRIKAIGISRTEALDLAGLIHQTGQPLSESMRYWPEIETELSDALYELYMLAEATKLGPR